MMIRAIVNRTRPFNTIINVNKFCVWCGNRMNDTEFCIGNLLICNSTISAHQRHIEPTSLRSECCVTWKHWNICSIHMNTADNLATTTTKEKKKAKQPTENGEKCQRFGFTTTNSTVYQHNLFCQNVDVRTNALYTMNVRFY